MQVTNRQAAAPGAAPLRERLSPTVPLRFPGFDKHYEIDPNTMVYSFAPRDCREWYREMSQRIFDAVDRHAYMPLYRMCDGEYAFALKSSDKARQRVSGFHPRRLAIDMWLRLRHQHGYHRSGSHEYGFELYTRQEYPAVLAKFQSNLREIAESGMIAMCLHTRPLCEPYLPYILDWLDESRVVLHSGNYYPMYAVYALMHGPDRERLLKGRRVLVVTGLTDEKKQGIERGLAAAQVRSVQFLPISLNKAMFDKIDLSGIERPIDLGLIGAGIGAANVLPQLRPLDAACLDVGFALSTLADPDLRWNRPFCVPDAEFDPFRLKFSLATTGDCGCSSSASL